MQVHDLVRFSKERCFNGAVQSEWFYDRNRVKTVAESYVFHGPKYFGVSDSDVDLGRHRLIDTASFALNLATKLYEKQPGNSFVMTIAGYGAGKSHLAVSLAALFSGDPELSRAVLNNIAAADQLIAEQIAGINRKKNLVVVLNGMSNFNLDAEILKNVRLSLAQNGISDDVLREITRSYEIARQFVEKTFSICQSQFEKAAERYGIQAKADHLKQHLLSHIESSNEAVEIVNSVYQEMTGDTIRWERGLSAGDVLGEVSRKLCGEGKPFHKVLILFDEFGRYIEYAAANPTVAGEAALQQIFEAVQSANGGILFAGFVQSELDSYLARIEKTSNIMRYVGRYKASENLFLSSNFETILANLIQKVDESVHSRVIGNSISHYEHFHLGMESAISRWDRSSIKKSVWTNHNLYQSVILRGCYPLHPITVWLLANMSSWMQQRSALTFAAEMVDHISDAELHGAWLPYVYPVNLMDSSIYDEMLNSEEKGLVQSQYCMLYRDILVKIGNKLETNEKKALQAILVVNIGRFAFLNREDAVTALRYCSNLKEEELSLALRNLEHLHGVISYDENANTFDLIAEANGLNEFKRVFARYKMMTKPATIEDCDETIRRELAIDAEIETSFAQKHHISSLEWKFRQTLLDSSSLTSGTLLSKRNELDVMDYGDRCRGELIFAYCSHDSDSEIARLTRVCKETEIAKYPLLILFLDDAEGEILSDLTDKKVLNRFSTADHERFQKYITQLHKNRNKKIIKKFLELAQSRCLVTDSGLIKFDGHLKAFCTAKFEEIYDHAPAFMFDGFENKTPAAANRYLSNICTKMFDRTLFNIQSYNALSTEEKNRIKACLSVGSNTSWQVYNSTCNFVKPLDPRALEIFNAIEEDLSSGDALGIMQIFGKFARSPYGMSMNAIALFSFYYIAIKDKNIVCYYEGGKLQPSHISDKIFRGGKLQSKEFVKIRLQKNTHVDIDLVRELCSEIMSNTVVEQCREYKRRLDDLLVQEGTSPENQMLVASTATRIEEGMRLNDSIYETMRKAQEILAEAKKEFSIQKFVRVFGYYLDTSSLISSPLPYVYSNQFKQQMDSLKREADDLLRQNGAAAIHKLTCKITQLSQFKSVSKHIANALRTNGYEELAQAAESHAVEVEENLLAKQKYEASLVELDKDVAMAADAASLGYSSCEVALEKMRGWKHFFDDITDMPGSLLEKQKGKIQATIAALSLRLENISAECHHLIQSVDSASSFRQVMQIKESLAIMLSAGLSREDAALTNECLTSISFARSYIENLPEAIDELRQAREALHPEQYGRCAAAVLNEIELKLRNLLQSQTAWVERFLLPATSKLERMSAEDCSNWIDRTSSLPAYLDQETLHRYQSVKTHVEQQLHRNRVQGVFVMYSKLTDTEKDEFKCMILGSS